MAKLFFENSGEEVEIETHDPDGHSIVEICEDQGVPFACTEGVCGTCVIEVLEGMEHLSPFTQEEKDFLGESDRERLACQCRIRGGCVKVTF
jgi:ferredoxin